VKSPSLTPLASELPYGTPDLDPKITYRLGPPALVQCVIQGCPQTMRPPCKGHRGEPCPSHGIYVHRSRTYSYRDPRRNIIVSQPIFASRLLGHPFKYESHRFGMERSEDALTWNVFRSLLVVGRLPEVACWITGQYVPEQPRLFLWGLRVDDDSFEPWDLLIEARKRFESKLPVERPLTEPDVALFVPGSYLVLIECKFTSLNTWYADGPRKDARSLTKSELLEIYQDDALEFLDIDRAKASARVFNQLWRNVVFAEWMAAFAGLGTDAFVANLTRDGYEDESCIEFSQCLQPAFQERLVHFHLEDLYDLSGRDWPESERLRRYLETKTAGLKPAFRLWHA
jgi:hypothetical protein